MLITPISEICDRYSIMRLKAERSDQQDSDFVDELQIFKKEIKNCREKNKINWQWLEELYKINSKIWDLEADIRRGKEGQLDLKEIGRRAIVIRELNKQRITIKNQITKDTKQGFKEIKIDHASA